MSTESVTVSFTDPDSDMFSLPFESGLSVGKVSTLMSAWSPYSTPDKERTSYEWVVESPPVSPLLPSPPTSRSPPTVLSPLPVPIWGNSDDFTVEHGPERVPETEDAACDVTDEHIDFWDRHAFGYTVGNGREDRFYHGATERRYVHFSTEETSDVGCTPHVVENPPSSLRLIESSIFQRRSSSISTVKGLLNPFGAYMLSDESDGKKSPMEKAQRARVFVETTVDVRETEMEIEMVELSSRRSSTDGSFLEIHSSASSPNHEAAAWFSEVTTFDYEAENAPPPLLDWVSYFSVGKAKSGSERS